MLYDIGFLIFALFYLPTLIFKGKMHGDFLERFGVYDEFTLSALAAGKETIWIQAVSVGEVALCKSLIPALKEMFPGRAIVLSTITETGNVLAKRLFSNDAVIIYFPLDFTFVVNKATRLLRPKLYIMIETEIWPNVIRSVSSLGVPSILINGRISDRSFGRYRFVRRFLEPTLRRINLYCMQSDIDAGRIMSLGAAAGRVRITGNMKFDSAVMRDMSPAEDMRAIVGLKAQEQLFVAGSTHEGEEVIILSIFKELAREFPGLRLLIAPRHVERAMEVERAVKRFGFEPIRISRLKAARERLEARDVLILDVIGHLKDAYAVAAVVFVGGSLVKRGGQNPIEPAVFERPVIFGPHMFNFKSIAGAFLKDRAAIQISDSNGLRDNVRALLNDEGLRARMGRAAKKVVLENRGATEKNIEAIKGLIGHA